jgi:NAD(P)-dependent dehydrogenase (short-subunit alcohol dehydrogenase family)
MTELEAKPGWVGSSFNLRGRVALVTGGSRGIGRTLALALADAGADVAVMARTESRLLRTAHDIEGCGVRALPLVADVTNRDQVSLAIAACRRDLGAVDILVNNTGNLLFRPFIPLPGYGPRLPGFDTPTTDSEWRRVFDVHLNSAFQIIRETAPSMLEQRWGRVINITSATLARAARYTSAYDSAKGALAALTRALAKEWARYGVTVNSIAPGHFRTEMTAAVHDDPKGRTWMLDRIPMRRPGRLEELGPLAVFLASDASSYVTGQLIFIDGGESL